MLRLAALILPLAIDTFAVAAALGTGNLSARQRLRLGLIFGAFEGGMPLAGLLAGAALGRALGGVADYLAAGALFVLGLVMLRGGGEDEERRARLLARTSGAALLGLGLSISLDELAMGFALGLVRAPVVLAAGLIALQAFGVTQLGLAVGARVRDALRDRAERAAGVALLLTAVLILLTPVPR